MTDVLCGLVRLVGEKYLLLKLYEQLEANTVHSIIIV